MISSKIRTAPAARVRVGDLLEEARRRLVCSTRLEDHCGDLTRPSVERSFERFDVVELERADQCAYGIRHAISAGGRSDVPVVPAVVAACEHRVAPRDCSGETDCGAVHVGARLAEAHALCSGHERDDPLGDLDLDRMRKRERDPSGEAAAQSRR